MEFKFPDVGEGIGEGKLVSWKVNEGDTVANDQVLAEVETDKAIVEIPSPTEGSIGTLHFKEGDVVKVGEVLVTFGDAGNSNENSATEAADSNEQKSEGSTPPPKPIESGTKKIESTLTPTPPTPQEHEPVATPVEKVENTQGPVTNQPKRILATPSTRRLAREKGIDIQTITGTGPNGRVTKQDLQGGVQQPQASTEQAPPEPVKTNTPEITPPVPTNSPAQSTSIPEKVQNQDTDQSELDYSGRRKAIGDHMVSASQAPLVTEMGEADVTDLVDVRSRLKQKAAKQQVRLTYLAFFTKAVVACLHKYPQLNAHFDGQNIALSDSIHIGIAVDAQQGLIVPVIHDAHRKSVLDIAKEIDVLASTSRDGTIEKQKLSGSTFTISSIGPMRVQGFTPIINAPEVAILGIGAIQDKPWVVDGILMPRKILTFSLTFDHRVIDGALAAQFLTDLITMVEDPELLVLEGI